MVTKGANLISEVRKRSFSGMIEIIAVPILIDIDVVVEVNGQNIPQSGYDDDFWYYGFVMPNCDVEIEAYTSGKGPGEQAVTDKPHS